MEKVGWILMSLLMVPLLGCKSSTKLIESTAPCEQTAVLGDIQTTSDPVIINEVKIKGNQITLVVQYSGGCADHNFQLIGSEFLSKSLPPIRQVVLVHQSNGDLCKMLKTDTLCFGISDLAYNKESGGEVLFNLNGWNESIHYVYQK